MICYAEPATCGTGALAVVCGGLLKHAATSRMGTFFRVYFGALTIPAHFHEAIMGLSPARYDRRAVNGAVRLTDPGAKW
jgi:hypothetical protein